MDYKALKMENEKLKETIARREEFIKKNEEAVANFEGAEIDRLTKELEKLKEVKNTKALCDICMECEWIEKFIVKRDNGYVEHNCEKCYKENYDEESEEEEMCGWCLGIFPNEEMDEAFDPPRHSDRFCPTCVELVRKDEEKKEVKFNEGNTGWEKY